MKYRFDQLLDDLKAVRSAVLDTSACVYFLNEVEPWATLVRVVLERGDRGILRIIVPSIVHLELLAKAFQEQNELERKRVGSFVRGTHFIREALFDFQTMQTSAEVRGRLRFKVADSIVVGTACVAGVEALIGNDGAFRRLRISPPPSLSTLDIAAGLPRYIHLDEYIEGDTTGLD